ncbi:hypothetical protein ACFOOP_17525 [Marinicaulis aureus]|uniref:Uncharacterized protein n=1 Tax=Hyphococcus aureus TaxID=2666033 RepID=A0ABW1KXR0_9PROT
MFVEKLGYYGIAAGAAALLLAVVHFWAGPFAPQPSLETTVAQSAVEIRDATVRALRGETVQEKKIAEWDVDKTIQVIVALCAGLAIILSVVGFVRREPKRRVLAGAMLGVGAITFQFVTWFAIALLVVILISAVLQNFDGLIDLG